jgi:hypothetical protein
MAVHCHTVRAPSAQLTADRFSEYIQRNMIWVYFPLPRADKLVALGNFAVGSTSGNWNAGNNRVLVVFTPPLRKNIVTNEGSSEHYWRLM